jgi:hypothetical protein
MLDLQPLFFGIGGTSRFAVARPGQIAGGTSFTVPAVYDLDFAQGGASSTELTASGFTFARTGTAWGEDGTSFATGVPRIIPGKGLLIEGARTNSIRNNSMTGVVAGSPGTAPTNWAIAAGTGLSAQIVGTGTIGGFTYLDVRVHGTAGSTTGCTFLPDGATQIAAVSGQTWTASWFWAFVGGTFANSTNFYFSIDERDSGAVGLAASNLADSRSSITASLQRVSLSRTLNNGSTAAVSTSVRFFVTNGAAIDATFRLAAPQLELGDFASSPILTTTTAVTRNVETCTATRVAVALNQGTVIVEARPGAGVTTGGNHYLWNADDGTSSNRIIIYRAAANRRVIFSDQGSATFQLSDLATITDGGAFKAGIKWSSAGVSLVVNGVAALTDSSVTVPAMTVERLGDSVDQNRSFFGHIRRIRRYPSVWTDSELQLATAAYDLDFASGAATAADLAVAGFATTRATTAWDHLGRSFASGAARVVPGRGLLVEGARTNLCLRSSTFANATWSKAGITMTDAAGLAPDGVTLEAASYVESALNEGHNTSQTISITSGTTYTFSCYAKALSGTRYLRMILPSTAFGSGTAQSVNFDLSTGVATATSGTATTAAVAVGRGWWRCSVTAAATATASASLILAAATTSSGTSTYAGDGASGILLWHAQLEAGAFAGTPIVTTSASVVRNAETNVATRVAAALAQGSVLIAATAAPGGDGLNSQHAWIIDDGTGSNRARVYRSLSNNAGMMVHAAAVIQADLTTGAVAHRAVHRTASRWATNNVAMSLDSAAPSTDAVATIPSMTAERLGHYIDGSASFWGYLRRVQRVTDVWDDATLALVSNGFDLPFALGATAADLTGAGFTFTRASTAYDLLGNAHGTNQPRISPGKGLRIEGARTNLVTSSNAFATFAATNVTVTAADTADPSGAVTAAKLAKSANAAANVALTGITVSSGSTYAASCYFRAGTLTKAQLRVYDGASVDVGILVNLATGAVSTSSGSPAASGIEAIGSGWYRAWFAAALAASSVGVYVYPDDPAQASSGYVHAVFAQLELGGFPSTPIVTTGTSATRSAETCIATRVAATLNQGTLLVEATMAPGLSASGTNHYAWAVSDGSVSNRVGTGVGATGTQFGIVSVSGVATGSTNAVATVAAAASFRTALRWATDNVALSLNGATPVTDTSAAMPSVTSERIGTDHASGQHWFGHIRRVARYGETWTDARLKAASYGAVL